MTFSINVCYDEIPKGMEKPSNQGKIGIQNCIATPKTIKYVKIILKHITGMMKRMFFNPSVVFSLIRVLIHVIVNEIGAILIANKIKVNQATTIIFIINKWKLSNK